MGSVQGENSHKVSSFVSYVINDKMNGKILDIIHKIKCVFLAMCGLLLQKVLTFYSYVLKGKVEGEKGKENLLSNKISLK